MLPLALCHSYILTGSTGFGSHKTYFGFIMSTKDYIGPIEKSNPTDNIQQNDIKDSNEGSMEVSNDMSTEHFIQLHADIADSSKSPIEGSKVYFKDDELLRIFAGIPGLDSYESYARLVEQDNSSVQGLAKKIVDILESKFSAQEKKFETVGKEVTTQERTLASIMKIVKMDGTLNNKFTAQENNMKVALDKKFLAQENKFTTMQKEISAIKEILSAPQNPTSTIVPTPIAASRTAIDTTSSSTEFGLYGNR